MAVWPKFFKQHNEDKEPTGYKMAVKAGYKGTYEEWLGLKMDSAPTEGSSRPITSGAVYSALAEAALQEDESGGGSGIFVVNMTVTYDEGNNTVITSDKTVDEIIAAASAGKTIMGKCIFFESEPYYTTFTTEISTDPVNRNVVFWYTYVFIDNPGGAASASDEIDTVRIYWNFASSEWNAHEYRYQLTPVSSGD